MKSGARSTPATHCSPLKWAENGPKIRIEHKKGTAQRRH